MRACIFTLLACLLPSACSQSSVPAAERETTPSGADPVAAPVGNPVSAPVSDPVSAPVKDPDAGPVSDAPSEHEPELEFVECSEESRKRVGCTREYMPVCAEVDTGVRCVTTPCPSSERKQFANKCLACSDLKANGYYPMACNDARLPKSE